MTGKLKMALLLAVVGLVVVVLTPFSTPVGADGAHPFEVIASGLDNPRGLAFGPKGALYVVEAGRGGDGPCVEGPFGETCFGPTGAVTRISHGTQKRIVTGLSSFALPDGGFALGPHDISFRGRGGAYVVIGACIDPENDEAVSRGCGQLIRLRSGGGWRTVADLTAYEVANNPDGSLVESNPFAVLALPGKRIVVDAAGNDLLRVAPNGDVSTLAVFPPRDNPLFPDIGGPTMDVVPASVAVGPDGAFYVGELTGFPFPVGEARIYRVVPGEEPEVYADSFTNVIDIAFDDEGNLLVLEIAKNSLRSGDQTGALVRLHPDGSRETLVSEGLIAPTAVAIGDDDALYISNCGVCAGDGQVIRIELDDDD